MNILKKQILIRYNDRSLQQIIPVSYIESTLGGYQWLKLQKFSSILADDQVDIVCTPLSFSNTQYPTVMGSRDSNHEVYFQSNGIILQWGNTKLIVPAANTQCYLNRQLNITFSFKSNCSNAFLFSYYGAGGSDNSHFYGRMNKVVFRRGMTEYAKFLPYLIMEGCRYLDGNTGEYVTTTTNKPGMMEMYTNRFYTNRYNGTEFQYSF